MGDGSAEELQAAYGDWKARPISTMGRRPSLRLQKRRALSAVRGIRSGLVWGSRAPA